MSSGRENDGILTRLTQYYSERLDRYGPTVAAVDYNSEEAQTRRFVELLRVVDASRPFTIIDYGCAYGALYDHLDRLGWRFEYFGVDLSERMVAAGRETHRHASNARFTTDEGELPVADYLVASGTFSFKLDADADAWRELVCATLLRMAALCTTGLAFNLLTRYSDEHRMAERPDLYFGDPLFFFDFCKRNLARNVALLHDYELFDFTILVRKRPVR